MPPRRHLMPPRRHPMPPRRHPMPPRRHPMPPRRHACRCDRHACRRNRHACRRNRHACRRDRQARHCDRQACRCNRHACRSDRHARHCDRQARHCDRHGMSSRVPSLSSRVPFLPSRVHPCRRGARSAAAVPSAMTTPIDAWTQRRARQARPPLGRASCAAPSSEHVLDGLALVHNARALASASTCPSTTEGWRAQAPSCPRSPPRCRPALAATSCLAGRNRPYCIRPARHLLGSARRTSVRPAAQAARRGPCALALR
jgi:hypothetical protein